MKEIEVVYEKGVFKPLEDVELKDGVKGKDIHIDEERDEMIRERISDRHENIS